MECISFVAQQVKWLSSDSYYLLSIIFESTKVSPLHKAWKISFFPKYKNIIKWQKFLAFLQQSKVFVFRVIYSLKL